MAGMNVVNSFYSCKSVKTVEFVNLIHISRTLMRTKQSSEIEEMQSNRYIREAYHAGKWYKSDPTELNATLSEYLTAAEMELNNSGESNMRIPRGVIAPHAGFSYSGPTAAYAYNALGEALKTWCGTVVVLHPSHHLYLDGCAVSGATTIETPLGDLTIDESLRSELLNTGHFSVMDQETDQREHSGEMQYPYIAKMFLDCSKGTGTTGGNKSSTRRILPIMVGGLSNSQENHFGQILATFLARENVFTVISSDFCHWGQRFGYNPTSPPDHIKAPSSIKEIYQYVSFRCVPVDALHAIVLVN